MRIKKIYHPDWFQGNLRKQNYFEGWYFKQVTANLDQVISIIPGISLNAQEPHSFIQYINGITGETHYFSFPVEAFRFQKNRFHIEIGPNRFSADGIELDLQNETIQIRGSLQYTKRIEYPSGPLNPGIMGWYSFIPTMECNHAVVTISSAVSGSLTLNQTPVNFNLGKGYIEKDWGTSFPETWIWLQCNNFTHPETSLMFSVAKIPWKGKFFMGFIAFIRYKGELIRFATYNKSKILEVTQLKNTLTIRIHHKNYSLEIFASALQGGILRAPVQGIMNRHIKESIDAEVLINLFDAHGTKIYTDKGRRAGLEIMESIFAYMNPQD